MTKTYPLRRGAAERVELSYDKGFKNIVLRLGGQELATYPNKSALKDPQTFSLEDGSTLQIRFKRGLDLRLNGHALPGSTHDAMNYLRNAYGAAYAIAILNILLGLIVLVAAPSFLEGFSPIGLLIAGVIYGALGYFIQRQSMIVLAVATVFYCLDTV
ncbi:MAG: hypothetical protein IGR92_17440 [Leptolyngbyaceae cyanobacterium T60_A2020_046]|nr:hypothetical protein [Leptolyngbyaceae cyanobacterium T60_A2020_046]